MLTQPKEGLRKRIISDLLKGSLCSKDVVTVESFHDVLQKTFSKNAFVVHIKRTVKGSRMCDLTEALKKVKLFSQYRYFAFSKVSSTLMKAKENQTKFHEKMKRSDVS